MSFREQFSDALRSEYDWIIKALGDISYPWVDRFTGKNPSTGKPVVNISLSQDPTWKLKQFFFYTDEVLQPRCIIGNWQRFQQFNLIEKELRNVVGAAILAEIFRHHPEHETNPLNLLSKICAKIWHDSKTLTATTLLQYLRDMENSQDEFYKAVKRFDLDACEAHWDQFEKYFKKPEVVAQQVPDNTTPLDEVSFEDE